MILAFSRFRVANELGNAVREAFLNRPGLVDKVPGFLGLEAFTDTEDAAVFYLITRWTDVESFRRWHGGPDHRQSHEGIPKGLKLDPSFTLVRTLERISGSGECLDSDSVRDCASAMAEFLAHSASVHWLKARPDGAIVAWNEAMAQAVGGAMDSADGAMVWSLLTEADAASLRGDVESGSRDRGTRRRLNFAGSDGMPFTLECQVDIQPDGFVAIGEAAQRDERALQSELMALNNRLAVLLRENSRQAKALRVANAGLEKAMKDLRESHWQLKKIQEVLPICMRCGKVKTGDATWEEVLEFLKRNSLFLSHGYCPACLAKELAQ